MPRLAPSVGAGHSTKPVTGLCFCHALRQTRGNLSLSTAGSWGCAFLAGTVVECL